MKSFNLCLQIYAASVMFGYFLRGVDKRFQLERAMGLISDVDMTDAASRLEKLFQEVSSLHLKLSLLISV